MDGRNIRASYGTSKYCSSFIKTIKCSNPDCTYLHSMGDAEDTFSKQEIQAGYVTSGRDVMVRQQQMAAALANPNCRKKIGGGGPSGTGKAASNPVFPPPTFEEQFKPQSNVSTNPLSSGQFPPVHQHHLSRSTSSSSTGFSVVAANGPLNKVSRSQSLSAVDSIQVADFDNDILECDEINNPTFTSNESNSISHPTGDVSTDNFQERRNSLNIATTSTFTTNYSTTAASVVAGGLYPSSKSMPTSTLSALTPLKRTSSLTSTSTHSVGAIGLTKSSGSTSTANQNIQDIMIHNGQSVALKTALSSSEDDSFMKSYNPRNGMNVSPSSSISSNGPPTNELEKFSSFQESMSDASIRGSVIGSTGPNSFSVIPPPSSSNMGTYNLTGNAPSTGLTLPSFDSIPYLSSSLGLSGTLPIRSDSVHPSIPPTSNHHRVPPSSSHMVSLSFDEMRDGDINLGKDLGSLLRSSDIVPPGVAMGREMSVPIHNPDVNIIAPQPIRGNNSGVIGGGRTLIGGTTLSGTVLSSTTGLTSGNFLNLGNSSSSGSSILASMLGIELPTGSGSLRDSLWDPSPQVTSSLSSKSSGPAPPPPIGSGMKSGGDVILGRGFGVSNPNLKSSSTVDGPRNNSDIALLQSLLPGVHITSGGVYHPINKIPSISNDSPWMSTGHTTSSSIDRSTPGNADASYPLNSSYVQAPSTMPPIKYEPWGELYISSVNATQLKSNDGSLPIAAPKNTQQFPQGPSANIW
jgi:hypothetical protein